MLRVFVASILISRNFFGSWALCEKFGILDRRAKESGFSFWEEAGILSAGRKAGKNPLAELVPP
jgi:hypothetical protein